MRRVIRYLVIIVSLTIMMIIGASAVSASEIVDQGTCGDNITWVLDSDGVLTISGTGDMNDYETASACPWYSNKLIIEKVVVGNDITRIGDRSFYSCNNLKEIIIGSSVTTIGSWAIYNLGSIKELTMPSSLITLENSSIRTCPSLSNVFFIGNAPTLGNNTLYDCSEDFRITVHEGSTGWDSNTWASYNILFDHIFRIKSIETEPTCTENGFGQFECCVCGEEVDGEIPALEHYYVNGTCSRCGEIQVLAEGNGWVLYGTGTLEITTMQAWSGGTWWGDYKDDITEIIIEQGVTSIESSAFEDCINLTSVTIPNSVTVIGNYAFRGCISLTNIVIPEGVTTIGADSFRGCGSLVSITIPYGVTYIGSYAFCGCSNLNSIIIPNSVTGIGENAFKNCSSLTSVDIPNGVTVIKSHIFYECTNLSRVSIPDSVTSIESYAFGGCRKLTSINIPDSVAMIGDCAFYDCRWLKTITIPDNVTSIGYRVFYHCLSLTDITIPEELVSIGIEAFAGCEKLTAISIPDGVTSIRRDAFSGCTKLRDVYINDIEAWCSIVAYSGRSFPASYDLYLDTVKVTDLVIPETITCIKNYAFNSCISLTSVTIPNSVTSIGDEAFCSCSNLTSITIPEGITSIGSNAFSYCNIQFIFYGGTEDQWNNLDNKPTNGIVHYSATGHTYGEWIISGEPTCRVDGTKEKTCTVCGDTVTETIPALDHSFSNEFTVDVEPTCTVEGSKSRHCINCDEVTDVTAIPATGHNYAEDFTIDQEPTCTAEGSKSKHCLNANCDSKSEVTAIPKLDHTYGEWTITTEPTCTTEGSKEKSCTVCGDKVTEDIPATGHNYADEFTIDKEPTCTEEGSQSKHCKNANCDSKAEVTAIPKIDHTYGNWTITKEATCTVDGSKEKSCTVCGDKVTEEIPATGHNYADDFTVDQEPTCTEKGSKSKHCANCDAVTDVTEIPANGHTFGNWIEITPSTCEDAGFQKRVCRVCGFSETQYLDPNGHEWEADYSVDVEPTCTENGSKSKHCANCEAIIDSKVIPATGHKGSWNVVKDSTCTDNGTKEMICTVCGEKTTDVIPAKGHSWNSEPTIDEAPTCTKAGSQSRHCARCSETMDVEALPALSHDWMDMPTVDKDATCIENGVESIHCSRCGTIKEGTEQEIHASGHYYSAWTTIRPATELAPGNKTHKCTVCGRSETAAIAQLAPTLISVKISTPKKGKKSATIKWKKVSKKNQKKIGSIQIQYSLDRAFKSGVMTVTAKKSAKSKKIKGLASKRTYYVRIRAYNASGGVAHVSNWSAVKSVKIK